MRVPDSTCAGRSLSARFQVPPGLTRPDRAASDRFEPGAEPAPTLKSAPPATPSWKSRLARGLGYSALAVTGVGSLLGGIAYQANQAAFQQAPSAELYLDQELFELATRNPTGERPAPPPVALAQFEAAPATEVRTATPQAPPRLRGVTVYVTPEALQDLQHTPAARQLIAARAGEFQQALQRELNNFQVPSGQALLDVHAPLPTGDRPLLRLGSVDLPSAGYRGFETGTLPLTVGYSLAPVHLGFDLQVEPVEVERPLVPAGLQGPGAFLGALRVRLTPEQEAIALSGRAQVGLDRDGAATRARLQQVQDPALRQRLQSRLEAARRLQRLERQPGLSPLLEGAFHGQEVSFAARAVTGRQPLEATVHLWMTRGAEGQAELAVATESNLESLQALNIELDGLQDVGQRPDGWLTGLVRDLVQTQIQQGITRSVAQAGSQLRTRAAGQVQGLLEQQTPELQRRLNAQFGSVLAQLGHQQLPVGKGLEVGTPTVRLESGLITAHFGPGQARSLGAPRLEPGEIGVRLDRTALNQQLRDRSQGGVLDWESLLEEARSASGMRDLSLGKDPQGQTEYPQLVESQSGLAIQFHASGTFGPLQTRLDSRVTIGLQLRVEAGRPQVVADLNAMKLESPGHKRLPFDTLSLIPTRLVAGLITDSLATVQTTQPVTLQAQQGQVQVGVNPGEGALQVTGVETLPGGDIFLRARAVGP